MTLRTRARRPGAWWPGAWWPSVHWPSVRGRARADVGPLLLVAGVVLVVTLLASAVPPLLRSTADAAARDAIRRGGVEAAVQVEARLDDDYGPTGGRMRNTKLATDVEEFRNQAAEALDPSLRALLGKPVTTVNGVSLKVRSGNVPRHFQLNYLLGPDGGPAVTWVAGHAPRGTVEGDVETPYSGPPWEAQVGLSETEAAALKVRPGDHLPVEDEQRNPYNVLVSGVFRPVDPDDPTWQAAPWLLEPVPGMDGAASSRFGGLLSTESLPDGRLALLPDQMTRTAWFRPDPDELTWESAQRLASTVVALKASSASSADRDSGLKWYTQLDHVLEKVRAQVDAAYASAFVLLIAVLAGAALVLLLAADLLARRRATALTAARQRGASLPAIATELLLEAAFVAFPAAALGLVLSLVLAGGAAPLWALSVVLCALLAGPAFGVLTAARATRDRRAPANRSARRWQERTGQLRRAAVDVAVVAAAAGAVVALRQRGVSAGPDLALPAGAPTLGVLAAALLLLRLMPAATGFVLRRTLRSRRPLAVFGAAQAAATATRALPLLVLTATAALSLYAGTLDATASRGLVDGAWRSVGADARLDVAGRAVPTTPQIAERIAAAPGVDHAVAAQVEQSARVIGDDTEFTPTLVVVDTAAYGRMLADDPLPDPEDLGRLTPGNGPIPVLVRSRDGGLRPGMTLHLLQEGAKPVELTAVGTAPAVNDAPDVILMDAAAGLQFVPNTVWISGPGAVKAVGDTPGTLVTQAGVLRDRRNAPINAGLVALDRAAAGTLLVLGLLGFAASAAASAPGRWTTLARLRTLGLRPRDTYRVAAAELLPPVLVAAVCGPLLGLLLVELTFPALALETLTGQTAAPSVVVPWWLIAGTTVVLLGALIAVVAVEAAVRRARRLGDVLRVGGA